MYQHYQHAAICTNLYQPVPSCINQYQSAPSCTNLLPYQAELAGVVYLTEMRQSVPNCIEVCTNLYQLVPICTNLNQSELTIPICIKLYHANANFLFEAQFDTIYVRLLMNVCTLVDCNFLMKETKIFKF